MRLPLLLLNLRLSVKIPHQCIGYLAARELSYDLGPQRDILLCI